MSRSRKDWGLIFVVGALLATSTLVVTSKSGPTPTPTPKPIATFTPIEGLPILYQFLAPTDVDCPRGTKCWGVAVIPQYACNDIIGELVLATDDAIVDRLISSVGTRTIPGQKAILVFQANIEAGNLDAKLSNLRCV